MIEIKNLTKIYRASLDKPCKAIDNISLNLPNTGMIFITGKSGSGKSTLLNMIGTLDNISRGDIYIESRSLKKFKEKEAQEYRSSYLGFIFQDFLLLDELTVKENIEIALNISGIHDDQVFKDIIKKVDLEGKEDKFPSELSGGQKQRVAIARALIKNPKLLLCDEPTGNLDHRTSKQILNILKEESKTKLVIIVSHNINDAENYADRIIELYDGKVINDNTKKTDYVNEFIETENYVLLPHHKDLTNKELTILNNKVKNQKFRVAQNKGGFFKTKEVTIERGELELSSSHISHKNSKKLASMFFRKNKKGAPYVILMTTLLISLFYIFQMFISFNGNKSLESSTSEIPAFINITKKTDKGTLSGTHILPIVDKDIKQYYDNGYEGKHFKLYNYAIDIDRSYITTKTYSRLDALFSYNQILETLGTLQCNEEFLVELFGVNGKLNVLAGDITMAKHKLVITDYIADILMTYNRDGIDSYVECLDVFGSKICAIVYTGYKEKYAKVFEDEEKAKQLGLSSKEYLEKNREDDLHISFLNDVINYYSINYCFSENFYTDMLFEEYTNSYVLRYPNVLYKNKNHNIDSITFIKSDKLEDGQLILSYSAYNELFNTLYSESNVDDFKPHKIKVQVLDDVDQDALVIKEREYEIIGLGNTSRCTENEIRNLIELSVIPYGIYFDNVNNINLLNKISDKIGLYPVTLDTGIVPVINTILSLFKTLCLLITALLFIASFIHVIVYGVNSIRRNIYEIGVLKSLGAKSTNISKIFIRQIIFIGLALSITSVVGIYLSSLFSDKLLVSAFEDFMTITIFDLDIIRFDFQVLILDICIVFLLTIVSAIIPLMYLKSIKPLNILKGKRK